MKTMIWCGQHWMPVEGDLRVVRVDGSDNSFAFDTNEMWCQAASDGFVKPEDRACQDFWQTVTTIDSH